jgi:hypothetical protein
MAKRAPADQKPYRPVDEALVRSVILSTAMPQETRKSEGEGESAPVVALPHRSETQGLRDNVVGMPAPAPTRKVDTSATERLSREKRVLLSPAEEREVERLVQRLAEELHSPVKLSHVLRACIAVLCHGENELLKRAKDFGPLVRPANGDAVGLARFEHALSQVISEALRDAPAVR